MAEHLDYPPSATDWLLTTLVRLGYPRQVRGIGEYCCR
ncbi:MULTISPECIES: hypothetical protein [unclassified Sulfitobacter]